MQQLTLDEITMSGSVNDGDIVLGSLELPESDVDGDTTVAGASQNLHEVTPT